MKFIKRTIILILIVCSFAAIAIVVADYLVEYKTAGKVYNSTSSIPYNKVGLFLGTAKYLNNGHVNLYYKYRIEAAIKLYNAGKVDYILISGDNSTQVYDEPTTIKEDLILGGIPEDRIYLDYAGFRTLDSVVRSHKIFGQSSVTIISQQFHNERAIYIAYYKNMEAIGFNAKSVSKRYGFKVMVRERLARVKMMLDLLVGKQPKFLGKKISIG